MPIDKVYILNLPDNIERRWACYAANVTHGVPENLIYIWRAIPGNDFESIAAMVEEANRRRVFQSSRSSTIKNV